MRCGIDRFRRCEGYTFNELLVAISIIIVTVLSYSLGAMDVIRRHVASNNLTVAIHLAQDKIEQLKALPRLNNENRCPVAGERGLSAAGTSGGIFDRCWSVSDSPLGKRLKRVDVKVSWQDHVNHEVNFFTLVFDGADT